MTVVASHRRTGVAIDFDKREKDDFTPTPESATRALLSVESFDGPIWECACGDGAISTVLEAVGYSVVSTDLVDRGYGQSRVDFLMESVALAPNIMTNPPFKYATAFIKHARAIVSGKVVMLLPTKYIAGNERGRFFREHLTAFYPMPRRISDMRRGGTDAGNGGGSMMDFAWFVLDPSKPPLARARFDLLEFRS